MAIVAVASGDPRRASGDRAIRRDIPHDHKAVGSNLDVVTHGDRSQKNSTGSDQNVVADGWMPFTHVFTRSPERDVVKHDTVASDDGGFTNHDTGAVVTEVPLPYFRTGVNFQTGQKTSDLRKKPRQEGYTQSPEQMNETVSSNRLKSRVKDELNRSAGRIVAIAGLDVFN